MKLIKKLEARRSKHGHLRQWGLFQCLKCESVVERSLSHGRWSGTCSRICGNITRTHGDSNTKLYRIWCHMKERCYNKNDKKYEYYGDKGIRVCRKWHEYLNFKKWALTSGYKDDVNGCNYKDLISIDRINDNGNYEPSNCQWITMSENSSRSKFKFTMEEANQIRKIYAFGKFTKLRMSKAYGVCASTMGNLLHGRTYTEAII